MITIIDFIVKAYTVVLLFRLILTQQELNFNFVGRGVAKLTDPLFKLGKVPKSQTDKFIPLVIVLLFFIYGVILAMADRGWLLGGVVTSYQSMFGFLALFFIICVLLGSMASPSTGTFPLFFYRLGKIFVKPVQKVIRVKNNFVIIPTTLLIFVLYMIGNMICLLIFSIAAGGQINILKLAVISCFGFLSMLITLLRYYTLVIIIRALLSWVSPDPRNVFVQLVFYITEPVLFRMRRIIPPIGMIDLSALVAIVVLGVLSSVLSNALAAVSIKLLANL